jgi:putative CocE/NonD family hydrolase
VNAFVLALLAAVSAQDPFEPARGTYIFKLGTREVGRETWTLDANRWSVQGKFDILGTQKADFEMTVERKEGGRVEATIDARHQGQKVGATLADGKLTLRILPDGPEQTVETAKDPALWENLVWISNLDLARRMTALAAEGKLTVGARLPCVTISGARGFEAKVLELWRSPQTVAGKSAECWGFRFEIPPGVEFTMVCSPRGTPLRIAVPLQSIDVAIEGLESIELPPAKPVSILDRGAWRRRLSEPKHEVVGETKVMIPMRDGVKLAADIQRPKTDAKVPTILIRTPYSRVAEALPKGAYFAPRGYAVVAQDVRGRFDSEGAFFPLKDETRDGSDTIDWIAAQPWSDGTVGMIGASYVGWVQWYAAKSGNPRLKAIVPQVSPPDPDQNIPYEGGVFLLSSAWWAKVLDAMAAGEDFRKIPWTKKMERLPLGDLDEELGIKNPILDEWLAHPPTDAAYWDPQRYQTHYAGMNVAVLNVSGWFDGDQPGAPQNFIGMRKAGKKDQYLVMGPWTHAFNTSRRIGETDFGAEAVVDLNSVALRFFDRYLKGVDNGIDAEDPVYVFVMGPNAWRREKDWPLPGTAFTKLYLAGGGHAHRRDGDGRLSLERAEGPPDEYRYDPTAIPETLADFNDLSGAAATADLAKLPDREDVLDYTSPPLVEDVELVGPFSAELWISTSAQDTDVAVEVARVTPDGKMLGIMGGIQRLRYRNGRDEPVRPGEPVRVTVDCWASGLRLSKGERIRVSIGSNGFPGYARNLGTLEPPATATRIVVATNRILHDAAHPSAVILPVVPRAGSGAIKF